MRASGLVSEDIFELGESPEDCLLREVKEETGLTLTSWKFPWIGDLHPGRLLARSICVCTRQKDFQGEMTDCEEGCLEWVRKERLNELNLWDGDEIFFELSGRGKAVFLF